LVRTAFTNAPSIPTTICGAGSDTRLPHSLAPFATFVAELPLVVTQN
jgi:hypothetical protein